MLQIFISRNKKPWEPLLISSNTKRWDGFRTLDFRYMEGHFQLSRSTRSLSIIEMCLGTIVYSRGTSFMCCGPHRNVLGARVTIVYGWGTLFLCHDPFRSQNVPSTQSCHDNDVYVYFAYFVWLVLINGASPTSLTETHTRCSQTPSYHLWLSLTIFSCVTN